MLNYTVSNLDSDKTFTFYYNFSGLFLINPFNICHIEEGKEDCQDYVAKYTFKKNEKYKICLKFEEVTFEETKYYYLPQYQFHKGTELKFGVETNFDKDHNAFIVEDLGLKEDDMVGVLIYIYQQNKESDFIINKLSPYSGMEDLYIISNPGEGIVYWAFDEDEFVLFIKGIEEEEKGTIWFNPLNREIEIDLSKKYEGKLPVKNDLGEDFTQPLTYSVSNLKEDKTFIFEYETNYKDKEYEFKLSNPFEICNGGKCTENVNKYNFKKGENYKIKIRFIEEEIAQTNSTFWVLPKYSFYEGNSSRSSILKLSFIPILILLLLLF